MEKNKEEYYKTKLINEKNDIIENIKQMDEDMGLNSSLKDDTSELSSYDNHPADIASETFEMEKNRALRANETTQLKRIEDSLKKMAKGKYGICELCKNKIDEERLEVLPYANLCINCEKNQKVNNINYSKDRPIEEKAIKDMEKEPMDYTGYDGEDVWDELKNYDSANYLLMDEDNEEMDGLVEDTDNISNDQYKRQLPD